MHRTILDVRRRAQLQDRISAKAADVVAAMHDGEALHLHHDPRQGAVWWLSRSGKRVPADIAQLVIANPNVVGVGDALPFGGDVPAQTFRFTSTK
jgi:hypothetical protein